MSEMKETGIQWLGAIPLSWEIRKIKYSLQERVEKNNPVKTTDILSLTAKQGVIPYEEKEGGGNKPKEDLSDYHLAYPGDIVMNSMNILSGSVGLSKYFGCVSPVYYMLRPHNQKEDVRFYNYIFQTTVFQKSLFGLGNGILIKESGNGKLNTIRMRIPMDKFGSLFIPIAPAKDQKKISDFLDNKCSKIDSLISDIQKQIEVLEQYKRSVITEAVTKGLDPNVEMKDSCCSYIGKIPKNWKVLRLKNSFSLKGRIGWQGLRADEFIEEGPFLITGTDFKNNMIDWSSCAHITEERFNQDLLIHVQENDLLISKDGTIGKTAIALNCPSQVSLNSGVFIVRNNREFCCNSMFLLYVVQSNVFEKWFDISDTGSSTIKHLTQEKFYNMKFPYPNLQEQKAIVYFLNNKCSEIDSVILSKTKQLELLESYKKSLIYECVTGKKEVFV